MKLPSPRLMDLPAEPEGRNEDSTTKTAEEAFGGFGGEGLARISRNFPDGWRPESLEKAYPTQPPEPPKGSPEGAAAIKSCVAAYGRQTPPSRAARKVWDSASGALLVSASPRAVLPVFARAWPGGLAVPAQRRSAHTSQRGRRRGRPALRLPNGYLRRQRLPRVRGVQPGVPLQAFENLGLRGGVRRSVRCLARGTLPILRLLTAPVSRRTRARPRGSHSLAESA